VDGDAAGKAWAAAAVSLAAAHARACRLVHWLHAQSDNGASSLLRLMPREPVDHCWCVLLYILCGQYNISLIPFKVLPADSSDVGCVCSMLTHLVVAGISVLCRDTLRICLPRSRVCSHPSLAASLAAHCEAATAILEVPGVVEQLGPVESCDGGVETPLLDLMRQLLPADNAHVQQSVQPPGGSGASVLRLLQPLLAASLKHVPTPGGSTVGGVQPGSAVATQFCSELWDQMILLVKAIGKAQQLAATLSRCGFAQLVYRVIQQTCAAGDEQHVKLVKNCAAIDGLLQLNWFTFATTAWCQHLACRTPVRTAGADCYHLDSPR
jgi:hypothetical protein